MYVLPLSFVIKWTVRHEYFLNWLQCGCACILYHFTALRSPFSDYVSCWQIPSNTTSGVTSLWEAWKRWASQAMNCVELKEWMLLRWTIELQTMEGQALCVIWECCGYGHCEVLTFTTCIRYRLWTGFEHHKSTYIIGYEDKCPIRFYFIQAVTNYFTRMMDLMCTFHCSLWNSARTKTHVCEYIVPFLFTVDWVIL